MVRCKQNFSSVTLFLLREHMPDKGVGSERKVATGQRTGRVAVNVFGTFKR